MIRALLARRAVRQAARASDAYHAYQSQPADGAWSIHIAMALGRVADARALRAAHLIIKAKG